MDVIKYAKIHVNRDDIGNALPVKKADFTAFKDLTEGTILVYNVSAGHKQLEKAITTTDSGTTLKNLRGRIFMAIGNYDEMLGNGTVGALQVDAGIRWYGKIAIPASVSLGDGDPLTIIDGAYVEAGTPGDVAFAMITKIGTVEDTIDGAAYKWHDVVSVSPYTV